MNDIVHLLQDRTWFLDNMFCIIPETPVNGKSIVQFKLRDAQKYILNNFHNRILIPKSRKIGMSTLTELIILYETLFNSNHMSVIIDYTEQNAYEKLNIVRNAWHYSDINLENPALKEIWKGIKERIQLVSESKSEMRFSNGSVIKAATNSVGLSPKIAHCSELGIISTEAPDKADKIKKGVLNSVPPDGIIIIESTTRSSVGIWSTMLQNSMANNGKEHLDRTEYKVLFTGWTEHPSYTVNVENPQTKKFDEFAQTYFDELENNHNIKTTIGQRTWWVNKYKEIGDDIYTEYPATIEESLRTTTTGQIYPQILTTKNKGRITKLSFERNYPLYTAADIGVADSTAIILFQVCGSEYLIHRHVASNGQGADAYVNTIRKWEREFNTSIAMNFLPHDAGRRTVGEGKAYTAYLERAGMSPKEYKVLQPCKTRWNAIRMARNAFGQIFFDTQCTERFVGEDGEQLPSLIDSIENYKRAKNGEPEHNIFSHSADAFRYIFEAIDSNLVAGSRSYNSYNPNRRRQGAIAEFRGL